MTTAASALPVLPPTADTRSITERVNVLIRWFNRPDLFVPSYAATDSGTGAAYVIAPSADIRFYESGQVYEFTAANANTSTAPTLAVQGLAAGVITRINGTALSLGDIAAGAAAVICTDAATPKFALISPYNNAGATTFLGSNVATPTIGTFTAGPNTGSIGGANQKFRITAGTTYQNSSGGNMTATARIFDGATSYVNGSGSMATGFLIPIGLSVDVLLAGAATFTLGATDNVGGSLGGMLASAAAGAANQATWITAERIA